MFAAINQISYSILTLLASQAANQLAFQDPDFLVRLLWVVEPTIVRVFQGPELAKNSYGTMRSKIWIVKIVPPSPGFYMRQWL